MGETAGSGTFWRPATGVFRYISAAMLSSPRDDAEVAIALGAGAQPGRQRLWIELPVSGSLPLAAVVSLEGQEAQLVDGPAPAGLFAAVSACFPEPSPLPAGGSPMAPLIEALPIGVPEVRLLNSLDGALGDDPLLERARQLPGPYLAVLLPGLGGRLSALLAKGALLRLAPLGLELPLEADHWRLPRVLRSGGARPLARRDALVYVAAAALPRWADLPPGSLEGFEGAAAPPRQLLAQAGFAGASDLYRAPISRWDRPRLIAR